MRHKTRDEAAVVVLLFTDSHRTTEFDGFDTATGACSMYETVPRLDHVDENSPIARPELCACQRKVASQNEKYNVIVCSKSGLADSVVIAR